jgi:hypothetical protein
MDVGGNLTLMKQDVWGHLTLMKQDVWGHLTLMKPVEWGEGVIYPLLRVILGNSL